MGEGGLEEILAELQEEVGELFQGGRSGSKRTSSGVAFTESAAFSYVACVLMVKTTELSKKYRTYEIDNELQDDALWTCQRVESSSQKL